MTNCSVLPPTQQSNSVSGFSSSSSSPVVVVVVVAAVVVPQLTFDRQEIVAVLVTAVLPRCVCRPGVYNRIADVARRLEVSLPPPELDDNKHVLLHDKCIRHIDTAIDSCCDRVRDDSSSSSLLLYSDMTTNNTRTAEELLLDATFLNRLLLTHVPGRGTTKRYIRSKLETIHRQLLTEIAVVTKEASTTRRSRRDNFSWPKEGAHMNKEQSQATAEVLEYQNLLPLFAERPYVHNFIVGQIRKLEKDIASRDNARQTSVGASSFSTISLGKRPGLLRSFGKRSFSSRHHHRNAANAVWGSSNSIVVTTKRANENVPTALERWMDVMALDEVLDDGLSTSSVSVRISLQNMKNVCATEAKVLQQQEARLVSYQSQRK